MKKSIVLLLIAVLLLMSACTNANTNGSETSADIGRDGQNSTTQNELPPINSSNTYMPYVPKDPMAELPSLYEFESLMTDAVIHFYNEADTDAKAKGYLLKDFEIIDMTGTEAVYEYMISCAYGPNKSIGLSGTANNEKIEYIFTYIPLVGLNVDGDTLLALAPIVMVPAGLFNEKYASLEGLDSLLGTILNNGTRAEKGESISLVIDDIEYTITVSNAMIGFTVNARDKIPLSAYYEYAEQSLKVGDLDTAIRYYKYAGEYKDAAARVLEVFYMVGQEYEKNNDYESAGYNYFMASDYSDAKQKCKECNYKQGEINLSNKKYLDAANCFENAANYEGATTKYKEACYLYAEQQLLVGSPDVASTYFKKAGDYKDASTKMKKYHYDKGIEQLTSKDYLSAVDSFKQIMDYSDASEKYKEANYLYGEVLLEQGQVNSAKTYLYNAKGYSDADTRIQRYYYEAGVALQKSMDYLAAAENFVLAGNYSDSITKEKECYYEYGKAQLALGYTTSGITYFEKCRGFKDTDEYVLSKYFKEAENLFNTYLSTNKRFDELTSPDYQTVYDSLKRCEGYGNSNKYISILNFVNDLWLSAEKAFVMVRNGKSYSNSYAIFRMEEFTTSYTDSTIILYEKDLQKQYSKTNYEATITTDYNKSYFTARVSNLFETVPWGDSCVEIARCIIGMFTQNYDDIDLYNKIVDYKNWADVNSGGVFEIYYGGYNIKIVSSGERCNLTLDITANKE